MNKYYPQIAKSDFVIFSGQKVTLIINDKKFIRRKNIKFHIKSDDYFGTLATVADLMKQEKKELEDRHNKFLENLKDDLIYLQKNYKIVKKK
ncbi:hypothetical protein L6259_01785 [Candidatus Parcubacteria bacterium]|nr:hypothetical protein [Patescibacteria group bacterium]MCG2693986.1 hypothetical protein [Candidatus Parcubacteria bacterium]